MKIDIYKGIETLKNNINLNRNDDKRVKRTLSRIRIKNKIMESICLLKLEYDTKFRGFYNDYLIDELETCKKNKNTIKNPSKFKIVDNIKFISDNDKDIEKLINYYNFSKKNIKGDKKRQALLDNLGKTGCIITNLHTIPSDYKTSGVSYISKDVPPHIYFDKNVIEWFDVNAFYHEVGHFYDMSRNLFKINRIIDKMDFNKEKVNAILKRINNTQEEIKSIIENQVKNNPGLIEMLLKDYQEERFPISPIKLNPNLKVISSPEETKISRFSLNIMDKIYAKSSDNSVSDIIEAIATYKKIKLSERIPFGHGREYYNEKMNVASEIFANFAELYTSGNDKSLDEVFKPDFRTQLEKIYMNTINKPKNELPKQKVK